ncbi:MAG: DUF7347 domain-containing protein [Promethearchaeota archaeon]
MTTKIPPKPSRGAGEVSSPRGAEPSIDAIKDRTRVKILKVLRGNPGPLAFTPLMKRAVEGKTSSGRFSYHLNKLLGWGLVEVRDKQYTLSPVGLRLIEKYRELERVLEDRGGRILVRTSRYLFEEFDPTRIGTHLVLEAGMDPHLAEKVAEEATERLREARVKYLTAPLIREYVNAILIENDLEEFRHKLTRLGLPGHDVGVLFGNHRGEEAWRVKVKCGEAVVEQYLLLNFFPEETADSYLRGELGIPALHRWLEVPYRVSIAPSGNYSRDLSRLVGVLRSSPPLVWVDFTRASLREQDGLPAIISLVGAYVTSGTRFRLLFAPGQAPRVSPSFATPVPGVDTFWLLPDGAEVPDPSKFFPNENQTTLGSQPTFLRTRGGGDPGGSGVLGSSDRYVVDFLNVFLRAGADWDRATSRLRGVLAHLGVLAGYRLSAGEKGPCIGEFFKCPAEISLVGVPEVVYLVEGFMLDETRRANELALELFGKARELVDELSGGSGVRFSFTHNLEDLPPGYLERKLQLDREMFSGQVSSVPMLDEVLSQRGLSAGLFREKTRRDLERYCRLVAPFQETLDSPILYRVPRNSRESPTGKAEPSQSTKVGNMGAIMATAIDYWTFD